MDYPFEAQPPTTKWLASAPLSDADKIKVASGNVTVLSKGRQEESPSFAPNGTMLIFAGRQNGQGMLQTVSVDGQIAARLDADAGEVREPVWGPFQP